MRRNPTARLVIAAAISVSTALAFSQQRTAAERDDGVDGRPANDMRRGLSREDERRNADIEQVSPARRIGREPVAPLPEGVQAYYTQEKSDPAPSGSFQRDEFQFA